MITPELENRITEDPASLVDEVRLPSEGLVLLERAHRHAKELGRDIWQFAVLVSTLEATGLRRSDLHWLVSQGHLAHAVEYTRAGADRRWFREAPLAFGRRTCFVLTDAGAAFLHSAAHGNEDRLADTRRIPSPCQDDRDPEDDHPRWDRRGRVLWMGSVVVKRFRRTAPNQEMILAAFEEQGWPERVDDPLLVVPDMVAHERLHDTIKCLNRGVWPRLIYFRGDGTGKGVRWTHGP